MDKIISIYKNITSTVNGDVGKNASFHYMIFGFPSLRMLRLIPQVHKYLFKVNQMPKGFAGLHHATSSKLEAHFLPSGCMGR